MRSAIAPDRTESLYDQDLVLKWQYQSVRRSASWRLTIINARRSIEDILDDSPSLRQTLPDRIHHEYAKARQDTAAETDLTISRFPDVCPFTREQLTDHAFFPDCDTSRGQVTTVA